MRKPAILLLVLLAFGGASAEVYRLRQNQGAVEYPTAPARKDDFSVIVRCRGSLRARRSVPVYAPIVPQLRLAWLAPAGQTVKEGESLIKFDSSSSAQQLSQKQAALRQAQATLDQELAQAKVISEQDSSDLADTKFNVEKARLEASKTEIVSKIQGEENKIDLGVAEEKLKVQQATVALHDTSEKSKIASLTRLRDQAANEVKITQNRIAEMDVKSPITGMVIYLPNYSQGWVNAKPFKVGDNAGAGQQIAEIPDLTTLEMDAKVEETDRGRISTGEDTRIRIDALPELNVTAKLAQISPLAEQGFEWPPTRSFHAYASLSKPDSRLRPDMNGGMDVVIDRIPNAISIPAKALFTHEGKPIVYVANHGHYTPTEIEILARNPDEIAVKGIPAGVAVALVDIARVEPRK
ncbi:MAG TPA: efflux RND transporter periplasmic adaptor subunit [Bryobacteraceae bacterium]|nr:efflux RND transporter periplasmic adaptor subunit [Bryobacteraceae bacterium]